MAKKSKDAKKGTVPDVIYAEVSVKGHTDTPLFDSGTRITSETVNDFNPGFENLYSAAHLLRTEGFKILQVSQVSGSVNIAGPPKLYEDVFKTKIIAKELPVIKEKREKTTATFLDSPDTSILGLIDTSRSPLKELADGLAILTPVYYLTDGSAGGSPSPNPPPKSYWHLDVPAGVSSGINAAQAHRSGFTGKGIKVVMTDTGHFLHPYFTNRGYRVNPTVLGPATENPLHDEVGHGTGESANIFAVAPDVEFTMVKQHFVNSVGAFNAAVELHPHVISCSWTTRAEDGPLSAAERLLEAAVANATRQGIIVVFAAGNGHRGFAGQHPDVISAGGVYMKQDGSLQATGYASGWASTLYPGRNAPDVCGLVGLPPKAAYIMLPLEPGDELDTEGAVGSFPDGDETADNDGWAAFSGTSAAAPQIAAICALMKQASPNLTPNQARDILKKTAHDVTEGEGGNGNEAGPGPDLATGSGLADAYQATSAALQSK
jgi:subtilisin family serine protease